MAAMVGIGPMEALLILTMMACPLAICGGVAAYFLSKRRPTNLQPCPDCGHGLSPLAKACPHCGRPLEK
jgi:hypothetical protein